MSKGAAELTVGRGGERIVGRGDVWWEGVYGRILESTVSLVR